MALPSGTEPWLFLAERYLPSTAYFEARAEARRVTEASALLSGQGSRVRYLGSLFVPSDETCFSLFEAESAEAVKEVTERAAVRVDRVVRVVRVATTP